MIKLLGATTFLDCKDDDGWQCIGDNSNFVGIDNNNGSGSGKTAYYSREWNGNSDKDDNDSNNQW